MHDSVRPHHLTRVRPNNCAFKGAFFGSNPLEFNCGAVKIGHGWHFTRCGEAEQSESARSGSGRQSPQALQHSHRTGLHRLDQALHSFFKLNGTMACGVIHGKMTEAEVSEFLITSRPASESYTHATYALAHREDKRHSHSSRRSLDGSMAIARSAGMAEAAMPRRAIVSTVP